MAHFAEFCEENLFQSADDWEGRPLVLEPWQKRFFGEAMAYGADSTSIWRSVVLILPRKNGKTASLAAYALYRLLTSSGSPEILLTASSDLQAGRLFQAAEEFVQRSSKLRALCRVRSYLGEIVLRSGQGRIRRMASDAGRLHGYNPSLVVCDELAQWTTPGLKKAFEALTSGGGARRAPQVFTITTAGEARDREDSILGRMLDGAMLKGDTEDHPGLHIARYAEGQMLVYNHEAPTTDPRDIRAMKLANPASWITPAFLAKQAATDELPDAAVLQLHGCVWAAGRVQWLPGNVWRPLADHDRVVEDGEEVILGFDGSYNNDSTALVGCTLDGHLWVEGLWERPALAREWFVPRDEVELAVHRALERYRVRELACDPPGWVNEIQEWVREYGEPPSGPVFVYETNKPSLMSPACSRFYTAIMEGEISHDGNPDLARHLANAVVKETKDGAYITKDGRHSRRKIDLAVAAVVAYDRAMSAPPALVPMMAFA